MPFVPHTEADITKMLNVIGVDDVDTLFDEIPEHLRVRSLDGVPSGLPEMDMLRLIQGRAKQDAYELSFLGAGAYEHHVPAAVWDITTRGEYMTAYTPYQAEASQGTLQLIYEFQSMMCALTGLDVSNASLYDGGSGLAEAVLMAVRANRKSKSKRVLCLGTVHPLYIKATKTITENQSIHLDEVELPERDFLSTGSLSRYEGQDYAALIIQQPNFFGSLEEVNQLTDWAHAHGMLVIAVVNPTSLALIEAPGNWGAEGADIAVGEGQPLGLPLASGGPYFGFMCCHQKLVRQMPGRIIGKTLDTEGREGYTLTLQAREQHIRRSKATSNICTNQGLAVTAATIYLSLLGAAGLRSVALASHQNTAHLRDMLSKVEGVEVVDQGSIFHEFVVRTSKNAAEFLAAMADEGLIAGLSLGDFVDNKEHYILVCATETKSQEDLQRYVDSARRVLEEAA